jgi:Family of unknown function (DUF6510)
MQALDGNAIAGQLFECFGAEMTTAVGACVHCGARGPIAELRVYGRPPGTVARCASCGAVVIVLVEIRGATRVDIGGFQLEDPPPASQ